MPLDWFKMRPAIVHLLLAMWFSLSYTGGASSFWNMFGIFGKKEERKNNEKLGRVASYNVDVATNSPVSASNSSSAEQTSSSSSLRGDGSLQNKIDDTTVKSVSNNTHDDQRNANNSSSSSSNRDETNGINFETDDSGMNDTIFDTGLNYQHKIFDTKLERLYPKRFDSKVIEKNTEYFEYDEKNRSFFSSNLTGKYSAQVFDDRQMQELISWNLSQPVLVNKRFHEENGSFSVVPTFARREPSIPDQYQVADTPEEWSKGHRIKLITGNHSHLHGPNASHYGHHGHGDHKLISASTEQLPITGMTSDGRPIRGGSTVRPSAHSSHEAYEKHIADQLMNLEAGQSKVVFVGDSCLSQITRDEVVRNALLKYHPLNLASPGFRTEHMMYRLSTSKLHKVHSASLFVVMIGTFNVGISNEPEAIRDGIIAIAEKILSFASSTSRVVVCSILPRSSLVMNRAIEKTNDLVRLSIRKMDRVHYLFLDSIFKGNPYPLKILNEKMYMPDHLHPSEKGYMKLVTLLRPYIADVTGTSDSPPSLSVNATNMDTSIPEGESGEVAYKQVEALPASSSNTKDDGKIVNEEEVEKGGISEKKPDFYNEKVMKSKALPPSEGKIYSPNDVVHQPKRLDVNESDDAKWQEAEKNESNGKDSSNGGVTTKTVIRKDNKTSEGVSTKSANTLPTPLVSAPITNDSIDTLKEGNASNTFTVVVSTPSPSHDVDPLELKYPREESDPSKTTNSSIHSPSVSPSKPVSSSATETSTSSSNIIASTNSGNGGGHSSNMSLAANVVNQGSADLTKVDAVPPAPSAELGEEPGFEPNTEQPASVIAHYGASETQGPPDLDEDVEKSANDNVRDDDSSVKKSKKSSKSKNYSASKSKKKSKKNKSKSKQKNPNTDDDDK